MGLSREDPMECFIVRIYRRDAENPLTVAGQVELVGLDRTKVFTTVDDLLKIILASSDRKEKREKLLTNAFQENEKPFK
jgi:hypothetical protein